MTHDQITWEKPAECPVCEGDGIYGELNRSRAITDEDLELLRSVRDFLSQTQESLEQGGKVGHVGDSLDGIVGLIERLER